MCHVWLAGSFTSVTETEALSLMPIQMIHFPTEIHQATLKKSTNPEEQIPHRTNSAKKPNPYIYDLTSTLSFSHRGFPLVAAEPTVMYRITEMQNSRWLEEP
jgi:hypothetical protein